MLDCNVEIVVAQFEPYVTDTIWLGKKRRCKMNGHKDLMTRTMVHILEIWQQDVYIKELYRRFRHHPKIRWKDIFSKVVGLNG